MGLGSVKEKVTEVENHFVSLRLEMLVNRGGLWRGACAEHAVERLNIGICFFAAGRSVAVSV